MAKTELSQTTPSKALLCLHGTGASANIFRMQLARFRLALRDEFEFVFMDAPYPARAGPGVLPTYAGAGPFHGWFGGDNTRFDERLETINGAVRVAVELWNATSEAKIVGVLAFSEGALVATMLLWQQQLGLLPWLPTLSFATLICCFYHDQVGSWMTAGSTARGTEKPLIDVPTVHLHGRTDFCLARARKLVENHYGSENTVVVEFKGGHQVPTKPEDCREAISRMQIMASRTIPSI